MTLSNQPDVPMTLQNFIKLIRENFDNNVDRSDFHIRQDILDAYATHAEA